LLATKFSNDAARDALLTGFYIPKYARRTRSSAVSVR
jgi:hypothetical protein